MLIVVTHSTRMASGEIEREERKVADGGSWERGGEGERSREIEP